MAKYTIEQKQRAVSLFSGGKSYQIVAQEIGCSASIVRIWVKKRLDFLKEKIADLGSSVSNAKLAELLLTEKKIKCSSETVRRLRIIHDLPRKTRNRVVVGILKEQKEENNIPEISVDVGKQVNGQTAAGKLDFTDFKKVFIHFDNLNNDESHFLNSNDICTPMECVKEMVDSVPEEFWKQKKLKILDSCCGNGNFHAYIRSKTDLKNLYFNEINKTRIANVREIFGEDINLTEKDFLTFDSKKKYDMVVSNPPYAKFCDNNKRASKNHNMSRAFIQKALDVTKDGGYLLFIVPDNWMSFSDRNILPKIMSEYQFIHLNIHGAKKWFPKVGSSFTWFLMQKVPNKKEFTVDNYYKKQDRVQASLNAKIDFIPLFYNDTVRNLMQKTVYADVPKYQVETTSDLHKTTKSHLISNDEDNIHKYKLIHTPKQVVWSSRPHKFQKGWKVFISLTDRYGTFTDNCGMTQSIAFIRCKSKKEAEKIRKELDSPVYRAINNLTRYGNFNNIRILQRLPILECIKLTKEEKKLVDYFAGAV